MQQEKNQRIAIIGLPGSGKSTFAANLGKILNVPVHHLDRHMFEPDGKKKNNQEFIEIQKAMLEEKAWVIEGCSFSTFESGYLEDLSEELADMLEVIQSIAKATGLSMHQIEQKRLEKLNTKGGFDCKIYCNCVDIEESNSAITYYLDKAQHYPEINNSQHKIDCIFCQIARQEKSVELVAKFKHCYAIKDQFPVSTGHVLIIPNEHTENWFTATDEVRSDMIKTLHFIKDQLDREYKPHGYNIGTNCGEVAGQSVMHLHVHLIPRYQGDMEDPKGGVRGVIPSKQKY